VVQSVGTAQLAPWQPSIVQRSAVHNRTLPDIKREISGSLFFLRHLENMTHRVKLTITVFVALIFSIVLSVQPVYRILPALLNESLSVAFWVMFSAWGLLRYRSDLKWLAQSTKSALFFCGVFLDPIRFRS
jgi:hypothetical protein